MISENEAEACIVDLAGRTDGDLGRQSPVMVLEGAGWLIDVALPSLHCCMRLLGASPQSQRQEMDDWSDETCSTCSSNRAQQFCLRPQGSQSMLYIPRQIRLIIELLRTEAIAQESKGVRTPVLNLEVLRPDLLDQALVQHRTASEQRRHSPVDFAIFVPTHAVACPDEGFMDSVTVSTKSILGGLFRDNGLDVFGGDFLDPVAEVVASPIQRFHEAAVADHCVWSHHHEVVGHV